jgi:Cu+-exporting ATPase
MACCFFVIFVLGKLINTCEALDLDIGVKIADSTEALREETGGGPTSQPEFDASSLTTLSITGMTCAACVGTLEKALLGVNGVDRVKVSLVLEEAMIIHKTTKINSDALIEVVENCGYEAEPGKRSSYQRLEVLRRAQELQVLRDSLMGIPKWAALLFILETLGKKAMGSGSLIGGLLATVTAACSLALVLKIQYDHGMWVHQNTWHLLLKTKANMNTLVSASITWGIFLSALNPFIFGLRDARSYLLTCTGLLMVITVGRYLEALTRREASSGLVSLYSLQARCAYAKLAKDHVSILLDWY